MFSQAGGQPVDAVRDRRRVARPGDMGDVPPAGSDEVIHQQADPVLVIGHVHHIARLVGLAVDVDDRDIHVAGHGGGDRVVVADHQHAVHLTDRQHPRQLEGARGISAGIAGDHGQIDLVEGHLRPEHHGDGEAMRHAVPDDESDGAGPPGHQPPRERARRERQLLRRGHDPGPRVRVNALPLSGPLAGGDPGRWSVATDRVYLSAGINKVAVTGDGGEVTLDKLTVTPLAATNPAVGADAVTYQAENGAP